MNYILYPFQVLIFLIQNIIIFHLKVLAIYFEGLSTLFEGDRVSDVYHESKTYLEVQADRLGENNPDLEADEDDEESEATDGTDTDS